MQGSIPPRFAGYRFEDPDFRVDGGNQASVDAAKAFVVAWPNIKKGLLFAGGVGTGKTRLAACVANAIGPEDVFWASTSDFLDSLRPEQGEAALRSKADRCYYGGGEHGNCGAVQYGAVQPSCKVCRAIAGDWKGPLEKAKDAPLLVLDDLGTAKPTEFVGERLYVLINYRLENILPIIATTNYSLEELAGRPERGIPARLGHERTASRLIELCDVYRLTGADRRVKIQEKTG